jgi:nitrogen fixation NifU-like protein
MNIYKELLTDHYRNPRNRGCLEGATFTSQVHNPSCGDSICIQGIIQDNHLRAVAFQGNGCVISQATASLLTEALKGKSLSEVIAFSVSDVIKLIGMPLGPVRMRCATLPLHAIQAGLRDQLSKGANAQLCEIDATNAMSVT